MCKYEGKYFRRDAPKTGAVSHPGFHCRLFALCIQHVTVCWNDLITPPPPPPLPNNKEKKEEKKEEEKTNNY